MPAKVPNPNGRTARQAKSAEIDAQIWAYRKAGLTCKAIGDLLDPKMTKQAVNQRLNRVLESLKGETVENAQHYKNIQAERIEDMIRAVYPKALKGDTAAVDRVLRCMEREAALKGLDAPKKLAETDTQGNDLSDDARAKLRARFLAAAPEPKP